ncbi:MAG: hypothetical protein EAX89_09140 [Candidatus Lokiarchaeota archaeon]|nr:hypothetical protein [Candidatus Lokiarchaeota archaeon]
MAYVVVTGSFPGHKASEIGKKFLQLAKLPPYVKTEHVFNAVGGKYIFFSIYEITEENKYFEGIKALYTRFSGYKDIEGYEYTVYPVLEAKDALKIIGLG